MILLAQPARVGKLKVGIALRLQVDQVGFQVVGKRRVLVVDSSGFAGGQNPDPHLLRPFLQSPVTI